MKQNLRLTLFVMLLFSSLQSTFAQEREITGTVTSKADNMPLPGVNVLVVGTTSGTQTDFNGNYSITASQGDQLSFSYLGMTTVTITVDN